jgi:hypothetical protein
MSRALAQSEQVPLGAYYTPDPVARACVATLGDLRGFRCWEPHAGGGAFVRALRAAGAELHVFADVAAPDDLSRELRAHCQGWHWTAGWNDDTLAEKARMMRNHGMQPKYFHSVVGGNFRMDTLQAALLRVKLAEYDTYTAGRQRNAAYYTETLSQLPGIVVADPAHCQCAARQSEWIAETAAKIILPVPYAHNHHIWNQYTLRVIGEGQRDALKAHLIAKGIGCEVYYPLTMDQQECFANLPASSRSDCEIAHRLATEVLSIPIYAELSKQQLDEVITAIADFMEKGFAIPQWKLC